MFQGGKDFKTGTNFIIKNTIQHVEKYTENWSVYLRQKQSRNTHSKERGCGCPPEWGAWQRGDLNYLYRIVLMDLCFPLASYLVLSFTPDQTQGPPQSAWASFGQDGFQCKAQWEAYLDLSWSGIPFLSDPEGSLFTCVIGVSLTPRMGST